MPRIVAVVPSVRPDRLAEFKAAWASLFAYHDVRLVVVWDGDAPRIEDTRIPASFDAASLVPEVDRDLFYNRSDCVRNYGFHYAAKFLQPDIVLTFDDDVAPPAGTDPVAEHLAVLGRSVPLSWMNTAADGLGYLRGVPYAVRHEGVVKLSHGVWTRTPDYDAPTQLQFGGRVPESLPYWRGPVPRGVLAPICGMSVAVTADALPLLYYAPQGPKTPFNRFADIWMGVSLKREFDRRNWAIYTGNSTVVHTRASDVFVNLAHEAEGLRVNETWWERGDGVHPYFGEYAAKRARYEKLVADALAV